MQHSRANCFVYPISYSVNPASILSKAKIPYEFVTGIQITSAKLFLNVIQKRKDKSVKKMIVPVNKLTDTQMETIRAIVEQ